MHQKIIRKRLTTWDKWGNQRSGWKAKSLRKCRGRIKIKQGHNNSDPEIIFKWGARKRKREQKPLSHNNINSKCPQHRQSDATERIIVQIIGYLPVMAARIHWNKQEKSQIHQFIATAAD